MRNALRTALLLAIAAMGTRLARAECPEPSASSVWSIATSSDGMRVYADGTPLDGPQSDCLYRSDDGGRTWALTQLGEVAWILSIQVDPRDPDDVWVASHEPEDCAGPCFPSSPGGLYNSTDGGETWLRRSEFHYALSIVINRDNADEMYLGDGSGVFKSSDSGSSWVRLSSSASNLVLSIDPTGPNGLFATDGRGLFRTADGGRSWSEYLLGGLEGPSPSTHVVGTATNLFVGAYLGVYRSRDGGEHWSPAGLSDFEILDLVIADGTLFAAGVQERNSVYFDELYRSDDDGATWALVRRSPTYPSALAWSSSTSSLLVGSFLTGVHAIPLEETVISLDFPARPGPAPVSGR